MSEGCLVGLELRTYRYGKGEHGHEVHWTYNISLKGYNEDYTDYLITDLGELVDIPDQEIEKTLSVYIQKAMNLSLDLEGFECLQPVSKLFCDFQKQCPDLEIIKQKNQICLRTPSLKAKPIPIAFLQSNYTGDIASDYHAYFENYFNEHSVRGFDLDISSIRWYESNSYRLLVFHLGAGHIPGRADGKPREPLVKHIGLSEVFEEPMLHHGKGFDYFVLKEK